MDNLGMEWDSEHGSFKLNIDSVRWIMKNVKTSMYNNEWSGTQNTVHLS
jgi:hypothetical protein